MIYYYRLRDYFFIHEENSLTILQDIKLLKYHLYQLLHKHNHVSIIIFQWYNIHYSVIVSDMYLCFWYLKYILLIRAHLAVIIQGIFTL